MVKNSRVNEDREGGGAESYQKLFIDVFPQMMVPPIISLAEFRELSSDQKSEEILKLFKNVIPLAEDYIR